MSAVVADDLTREQRSTATARRAGAMVRLRAAGLPSRTIAGAADALACLAVSAIPWLTGLISTQPFHPPPDLFLADHLLVLVAQQPSLFVQPWLMVAVVVAMWHFCWIYFAGGATPGMRLLGLVVVDGRPGRTRLERHHTVPAATVGLRLAGHAAAAATLGLGWLWMYFLPSRQSWPDLFSRSHIVRLPRRQTDESARTRES